MRLLERLFYGLLYGEIGTTVMGAHRRSGEPFFEIGGEFWEPSGPFGVLNVV
jgi:hypothetical protein